MTKKRFAEANKVFYKIAKSNKKSDEVLSEFEAVDNRRATELKDVRVADDTKAILESEEVEPRRVHQTYRLVLSLS
jgi:hypothetical protein